MESLYEEERKARLEGTQEQLMDIQMRIVDNCRSDEEVLAALRALTSKKKQNPHCIKQIIRRLFDEKRDIVFYRGLLASVVESKIYLEEERLYISEHIKALHGDDIESAYEAIKSVPVETFTSVSEKRKSEFLFEQLRLALLLGRYSEAELVSRRVHKGSLDEDGRVVFYNYSILLRIGQHAYLKAARLFLELNETSPATGNMAVGSFFCMVSNCLAEQRNVLSEKAELLGEFARSKLNSPAVRLLVKRFCSDLIIDASVLGTVDGLMEESAGGNIELYRRNRDHCMEQLRRSIIEHNLFVVRKFVSTITISQLCAVLGLSSAEVVDFISEMDNANFCEIRISQESGLVDFGEKRSSSTVPALLDKIVTVCNMIHQESISESK